MRFVLEPKTRDSFRAVNVEARIVKDLVESGVVDVLGMENLHAALAALHERIGTLEYLTSEVLKHAHRAAARPSDAPGPVGAAAEQLTL